MTNAHPTQPLQALAYGNQVRAARKVLKQKIREGEVDGFDLLRGNVREWERVAEEMRIDQLILALPGVGEVTRDEALDVFKLRPSWRLAGLSYALRAQLADTLFAAVHGEPVELPAPQPSPTTETGGP